MSEFNINLRTDYYPTLGLEPIGFSYWIKRFIRVHNLKLNNDYIKYNTFKRRGMIDYLINEKKLNEIKDFLEDKNKPQGYPHNLHDVLFEFKIVGSYSSILRKIAKYASFKEGRDFVKKKGFYKKSKLENQYYISENAKEAIREKRHLITQNRIHNCSHISAKNQSMHYKPLEIENEEEEQYYNPVYKGFEYKTLQEILRGEDKYYRDLSLKEILNE